MLNYLLGILPILVTLSVLILVHEWGHFAAAKWVGIQVPRFSLGLGPKVWGFRRGETEYVLSAIPLGGYVKMAGMEDDEAQAVLEGGEEGEPIDPSRTFDSKSLWARTLVISAGVIMNLIFAIVVFALLAGVYGVPEVTNQLAPRSSGVGAQALAQAARIPFGARVTAIGDQRVDTYQDFVRGVLEAPVGTTPVQLDGGRSAALEIPAGEAARTELLRALPPISPPLLGRVESGSAAARAGLQAGDRVVSANGRPVREWTELVEVVRASPGRPVTMVVSRGGAPVTLTLTPAAESERGADGKRITVGRAGVAPADPVTRHRAGPVGALKYGVTQTWATAAAIGDVLRKLFTGQMSARNLGGLISIGEASSESAKLGLEYFLGFLALFSVNLAVLNLLPIPILDGGHLMFLLAEAVRGRPLSVETRVRLSQAGLIVVVALMLLANGNDVVRKVSGWLGG